MVSPVIRRPHLLGDLQCLLEQFKARGNGWKRRPQSLRLLFIPCGSDAEIAASPGEHIERGYSFDEDAWIAVDHAGDQGAELHARGACRQMPEGGVALEHVVLGRPDHADLKEMVHHPQAVKS